jgi:two-component system sensor histidine kinase UhpB
MNLRFRLNALVSILFVTILVLGTLLVIGSARRAVRAETESTARLALALLEASYAVPVPGRADLEQSLRARLRALESGRLEVRLVAEGREVELTGGEVVEAAAPAWFVRLVAPAATELRRPFRGAGESAAEVVVRADPADEIAESWEDARPLLMLVLVVSVIANGILYVVIGRWLRPVESVVAAMDDIEQGDYRARLPSFDLPELDAVAAKFNRMAEVLERSREENRRLAQQSIAIQEAERRALARELHDELGQSIAAINAVAASMQSASGSDATTIGAIADRMHRVVRGMLRRLRPLLLDEFGLVRALQELVDAWNERHGDVFCRLTVRGGECLSEDASIGLFRVVQECLTNVSRHAQASEVSVDLDVRQDGSARLVVADDGCGFDPSVVRLGLGLLGMRERVEALSGQLALTAKPGSGVCVAVDVPSRATVPV